MSVIVQIRGIVAVTDSGEQNIDMDWRFDNTDAAVRVIGGNFMWHVWFFRGNLTIVPDDGRACNNDVESDGEII